MNKNKILIELSIPLIEKNYDLYIPINKKVGTVKKLIEEGRIALLFVLIMMRKGNG